MALLVLRSWVIIDYPCVVSLGWGGAQDPVPKKRVGPQQGWIGLGVANKCWEPVKELWISEAEESQFHLSQIDVEMGLSRISAVLLESLCTTKALKQSSFCGGTAKGKERDT